MTFRLLFLALVALATGCKPTAKVADAGTTSPSTPEPTTCQPELTLGTPLRLLTRAEYNLTVRDLLGATNQPAKDFPREPLAHGLDNDATVNQVTGNHVSAYLDAAEALAHDTVLNRVNTVVPCTSRDTPCGEVFVASAGLRAFRRPLTAEERATLNGVFATTLASEGFEGAVEVTLSTMLQSPQFLYRDEQALGAVPQAAVSLGGFELASRLSYFLWATMPDDELLQAAANGVLDTPEGLTAQATRMLASPKATDGMMRFFSLWLFLEGVGTTEKNTTAYPSYTPALAAAWRTSLELFVEDVITHEGTLPSLLQSNALFTNDAMSMYGPSAPGAAFVRTAMPSQRSGGLLTQPGFLAYKALPDGSSPVRRGVFVLDKLLCEPPPPPPAGLNITPPGPSVTRTTRERFAAHSQSDGCKACHQFIDPVGFTFEHYDGLGVWRDTENNQPIDSSGGVQASRDSAVVGPVDDVQALSARLSQSRNVHGCVAKEFYRFALGRPLTQADTCTSEHLTDRFVESGGSFKALMLAIVESQAFRQNANPDMTP